MFNQSLVPQKKQREHAQKGVKEKEKIYLKNIPANVNVEYVLFWMDTKERNFSSSDQSLMIKTGE